MGGGRSFPSPQMTGDAAARSQTSLQISDISVGAPYQTRERAGKVKDGDKRRVLHERVTHPQYQGDRRGTTRGHRERTQAACARLRAGKVKKK